MPKADRYSNQELLEDLRSVAEDLGKSPSCTEYSEHGVVTRTTIAERFGPWNDGLPTTTCPY